MLQNTKGSVEVAAKCFYRRKDLPPNILVAADRHASELTTSGFPTAGTRRAEGSIETSHLAS